MNPRWAARWQNLRGRVVGALRAPPGFAPREETFLETARRATGLEDFGPGPWRENLRVLLRGYDEEARLTPFGRSLVERELGGILMARLLVEEGLRRAPEARRHAVTAPVFILGMPRTGTTALHFLLAQDPDNQVLEFWLAAAPGPRPPREQWEADPRFQGARAALQQMYALDPSLAAIHLMTAEGPEECRHLLAQSFLDDTFDSNATLPSYTRWLAAADKRPVYERHRDVLRLIGSPTPEKRWVLKYPAHLRQLGLLLEIYPDARFVWTHRDPARVLPSLCSLVSGWRGLYEGRIDPRAIGRWQLDMWSGLVERGLEQRRGLDPDRFVDLEFREVSTDPIGAVKRLYDRLGRELSREAESRMRAWLAENPPGKHGEHRYSPERFGLSAGEMNERFREYREAFDLNPS